MILVRLMGGLGNQMFQYAFGLFLANKHNTILKIDLGLLSNSETQSSATPQRYFELDSVFNIEPLFASKIESELFNGDPNSNIIRRAWFKTIRLTKGYRWYVQNAHEFTKEQLELPNNISIIGRWQSELYFKPIEAIVRKSFSFRNPVSKTYQKYQSAINETKDSVAVHIRRTDYEKHPVYANKLGVLSADYYRNAIKELNSKVNCPPLFVFSDDISAAETILSFTKKTNKLTFIKVSSPKPHEELQLITHCKHHIISNSTFSWWGAWLANHADGLIFAPERWSIDPNYSSKHILPNYFLKVSC